MVYVPHAPFVLGIDITRQCNINCRHCIVEATQSQKATQIPFKQALSLIDQAAQLKVQWLDFNGGEPLLYPGFFELIKYSLNKGLKAVFITNGTLITEKLKEIMDCYEGYANSLRIGISLDGHTSELHGYFRPKETFTACVTAIKILVSMGVRPVIFAILHRRNFNYIPEFLSFISSLGVNRVRLLPYYTLWQGSLL